MSVKRPDVLDSQQIDDPSKCYVRWTLSTPSIWCVEDIKRKLECVTELSNFAIKFIYEGSLITDTSVSTDLITDPVRFAMVFTEFLQNFVKICEIDTTIAVIIDVVILASLSPFEGKDISSDKTEAEFIVGACRTCDNRNIRENGNNWCTECQELYCNNCTLHHQATTCSASHTIISINNEMKHFPPKILQIVTCDEHGFDLSYYCKNHQKIICFECIRSNLMICDGIVTLDCAAFNIKSSSMLTNAETPVEQSIADIEQVLAELANQSSAIELKKNQIESEIAEKFKSIDAENKKIDSILNDLKTKYDKAKDEIQNNVEKMKTSKQNISDIYEKLYQVTKYCSDIQAFSYINYITPSITKSKNTFKTTLNDIKKINLHHKTDENVEIVVQSEPYQFCSVIMDDRN
ncbi:unnamed protein product [Mytilus coruscus]|uniref:B box-type domain-containing protein n=1 Tax=Mytilus coruscus TaxID=42192 RepID=A0A6J8D710_MYTCO|nr:unnamed protein product [Mytilus coruscus]